MDIWIVFMSREEDSPTIPELCRQNKALIHSELQKAVCSSGLYIHASQQTMHLPERLRQPPVRFQCAPGNKQAHSPGASFQSAVWASFHTERLFDAQVKV